ncbi:SusC/RagA family TonB-linked outer membrane protein [Flavimarina sp. Hel_I_48]|uniref:SusC/RagA family TonB-linked outer membrane protein n=1 Tax=Flavimarina sp. Hel_I_48 TaxID=1392488 RepID=UPI0004DEDE15|nr:TonB-dependent receptor [Flavimarina sp. Hel_I_48]
MKKKYSDLILFVFGFLTFGLITAQQTITGIVSDNTGPLPGANVIVKGTTNGTTTDFDGNYSLANVDSGATLVFSYVGFNPQEIPLDNRTSLDVTLEENSTSLEDVVVIGYGTQSRAAVTGAISSVDSEEISSLPVATADQALQGRAAGVSVINSGSPGVSPEVRIRGLGTPNNNSPLYVIDGVISAGIGNLNANDIESIQVLKDASTTAVYGSQGSNGVVLVTTKQGSKSGVTKLTFDAYTGTQFIDQRYDVLNTDQYIGYARAITDPIPARFTDPQYADILDNNVNYQDEIFRTGVIRNYNLGLSGGSENSNFRFSAGYLNQEGAIIETEFERFSFRANSNFTTGKFSFGETMGISFNVQNPERADGGRSLIEHAIKAAPYLPVYNVNNNGGFQGPNSSIDGQDAVNPVRAQTLGEAINKSVSITGSVFGEYKIVEGLTFRSQVGLDYSNFKNSNFIPSYNDDSLGATHFFDFAQITKNTGIFQSLTFTNSFNYKKTVADIHNFEFLLLSEQQEIKNESINATSQNPISDEVNQLSLTGAGLSSASSEYNRIGYLGRLNYDYDLKYLFSASIRRDASSRFGPNNRWGWFPSVSLGWNIARESFMQDTKFSNLKLRGSYGVVGNDKIGDYRYSATLITDFIYPIAGGAADGTTANGLPNPNLKWEETTMLNLGLDMGLFNEKLTLSLEYYKNESDDLLINRPLSVSLGFNDPNITENVGSVETKGFEMNLGYNDYEGDFTWSASLNLGSSTNEVKSLGTVAEINGGGFEGENLSRITVGEPLFYFYGLRTDGIYQNQGEVDAVFTANPDQTIVKPGDIRFIDTNGDGAINADDRTKIGNPYPDVTYGFNANANYKNFDINVFVSGVAGNDVYNTNIYDLQGMTRLFNSGTAVLDRWTGPNTSTEIPRALGAGQNVSASDRFIEDGSYTRLRNVTLGYSIPLRFFKDYISKCRVYVSGQNLITLTGYSGLDPEVGNSTVINSSAYELGIDRGNYPQPKSFLFGLQLSF